MAAICFMSNGTRHRNTVYTRRNSILRRSYVCCLRVECMAMYQCTCELCLFDELNALHLYFGLFFSSFDFYSVEEEYHQYSKFPFVCYSSYSIFCSFFRDSPKIEKFSNCLVEFWLRLHTRNTFSVLHFVLFCCSSS